jgi:hypothetical protein
MYKDTHLQHHEVVKEIEDKCAGLVDGAHDGHAG